MRLEDLPAWVWQLLAAALDHEDTHGPEHPCLRPAVDPIPAEAITVARVLAAQKRAGAPSDHDAVPAVDSSRPYEPAFPRERCSGCGVARGNPHPDDCPYWGKWRPE